MQIAPNTNVRLLRNVPLDKSYTNTLTFTSANAQRDYFYGMNKYTYQNLQYQRKEERLIIPQKCDDVLDCNYIMFQNESFGVKWFYAFITNAEYISNNTTAISFEIDVMQTWYFDYQLLPSFVEREHSVTDVIGDNLVPENLELGEYVIHSQEYSQQFNTYKIVVASTTDKSGNNAYGHAVGRSYSGLHYNTFDTVEEVNDYIELITNAQKIDAIVSIFMMPGKFDSPLGFGIETVSFSKKLDEIDGYVPKNKKLLTHPYNFMYVTNLMGNSIECRYEMFSSNDCSFVIQCDVSCNPNAIMYPKFYKGVEYNRNEKIVLDGFPQCSYNSDTYKVWLAQNATSSTLAVMGSAMAVGVGVATANPVAIASGALTIANQVAQVHKTASQPPQSHGSQGTNTLFTTGDHDFWFMKMTIRSEFAKIIDEYFNMHGYATNRVKIPNTNSRPYWNYVKTINCNLKGSIPSNDIVKIKSIYDRGITFWKGGASLGNYNLDNSV